jgi:hypothetical protein
MWQNIKFPYVNSNFWLLMKKDNKYLVALIIQRFNFYQKYGRKEDINEVFYRLLNKSVFELLPGGLWDSGKCGLKSKTNPEPYDVKLLKLLAHKLKIPLSKLKQGRSSLCKLLVKHNIEMRYDD